MRAESINDSKDPRAAANTHTHACCEYGPLRCLTQEGSRAEAARAPEEPGTILTWSGPDMVWLVSQDSPSPTSPANRAPEAMILGFRV